MPQWNRVLPGVIRRLRHGCATTPVWLLSLASVQAQVPTTSQAPAAEPLETIVVTARRRPENLESVPISITAIGETELRERSIEDPTDLQYSVPSLTIGAAYGHLQGLYTVRGLPFGTTSYFAEVEGGPTSAGAPIFDVGSVQVLRGPQGTLFGRSSTAGAILFEPNRPDFGHWAGSVDVTAGNLNQLDVTAVLDAPLVGDTLAAR
jgi:iron complex outermembrane receptor protein